MPGVHSLNSVFVPGGCCGGPGAHRAVAFPFIHLTQRTRTRMCSLGCSGELGEGERKSHGAHREYGDQQHICHREVRWWYFLAQRLWSSQWFSTSLVLQPFNTAPHVVETLPGTKFFSLLIRNCSFATVSSCSVNILGFPVVLSERVIYIPTHAL